MYGNAQKCHFVHRAPACARPANASHQDHKVLLMVVATAIILLWIACFSALTGSILTKLMLWRSLRRPTRRSIVRVRGGLAPANFYERWNAIVEVIKASRGARGLEQIPEGCEPAFSRPVRVGNFSARVANVNALTRQAAVE
jgi:hypothetical protein